MQGAWRIHLGHNHRPKLPRPFRVKPGAAQMDLAAKAEHPHRGKPDPSQIVKAGAVADVGSAPQRELAVTRQREGKIKALKQQRSASRGSNLEDVVSRAYPPGEEGQFGASDLRPLRSRMADCFGSSHAREVLRPQTRRIPVRADA